MDNKDQIISEQADLISKQASQIKALMVRIADLERRLSTPMGLNACPIESRGSGKLLLLFDLLLGRFEKTVGCLGSGQRDVPTNDSSFGYSKPTPHHYR